ncbi:hypothetical protein Tco_0111322 [Tanacetum coccineum]
MTYMQQLKQNPKDISDPATTMYMALVLIAKAFKLNYTTPTNNNQIISSNPRNMGQDRQMQMVRGNSGNQFRQYPGQNTVNQIGYAECKNLDGTECSKSDLEEARIQIQAEEFDLMVDTTDCEEIEEVNANDIFKANLQQASTSGTHADKSPAYE